MHTNLQRGAGAVALGALLFSVGVHAPASAAAPPTPGFNQHYGVPIDITEAKQVAEAAVAEAQQRHVANTLTVAIVDTAGDVVYAQRGIAAPAAAMDVALAEARSAAFYGISTRGFYEALKKGQFKDSMALPGAASMGPGGVPIIVGGNIIGAIGATGGYDEQIADAGQRALNATGADTATGAPAQAGTDEPPAQPIQYGVPVNLNQIKRMIAAANIEAGKRHVTSFTMVVTDTDGELVYAQMALNARRAVLQITMDKARAAARYGATSRSFEEKLVAGDLTQSLALPGVAAEGWGGVPIFARGHLIGGVAVAGVLNPNDNAIATAAAEALANDDPFAAH